MKKKAFIVIIAIVLMLASLASFVACDKNKTPTKFNVNVINNGNALIFEPVRKNIKYGLLFYVGTGIAPEKYSYLGYRLAEEGYLAYIPKTQNDMPYQYFEKTELAFESYPSVQFFIGGHSNQGSDAALRRIHENNQKAIGAIFFSPITVGHYPILDKDGNHVKDEDGLDLYEDYTLSASSLPTLYISGDKDAVCTQAQIDEAKSRMSQNCTYKTIENGNHTAFANINETADLPIAFQLFPNFTADVSATTVAQKDEQRTLVASYVLQFIKDNRK